MTHSLAIEHRSHLEHRSLSAPSASFRASASSIFAGVIADIFPKHSSDLRMVRTVRSQASTPLCVRTASNCASTSSAAAVDNELSFRQLLRQGKATERVESSLSGSLAFAANCAGTAPVTIAAARAINRRSADSLRCVGRSASRVNGDGIILPARRRAKPVSGADGVTLFLRTRCTDSGNARKNGFQLRLVARNCEHIAVRFRTIHLGVGPRLPRQEQERRSLAFSSRQRTGVSCAREAA